MSDTGDGWEPSERGEAGGRELLLVNAKVYQSSKTERPAEAILFRNGLVASVGTTAELAGAIDGRVRTIDLNGRCVVPGFVESHNHPMEVGARELWQVPATTPPHMSIDDILEVIRERVRSLEPGEWLLLDGYDDTRLADKRHPTRWDLDAVAPTNPVYLGHVSGHLAVANTCALNLAGLSGETPDPPGGRLVRSGRGELTGLLVEAAAQGLVGRCIPAPRFSDLVRALELASDYYVRNGVTTVHDMGVGLVGGRAAIGAYAEAVASRRFRPRCVGFVAEHVFPERSMGALVPEDLGLGPVNSQELSIQGVKLWADGSIQGLTGALVEPYLCDASQSGFLIYSAQEIVDRILPCVEQGWPIAIHANGDRAIETVLSAYATVRGRGLSGERVTLRVEHCQLATRAQLERMAALEVQASFFIKHVYYWGDRHNRIFLGPSRAARLDPLATAKTLGVCFGLHSDCPVTPISPVEGMWIAVSRTMEETGEQLGADECISVRDALAAYTSDAVNLAGQDRLEGSLDVGRSADAVVLSADLMTVASAALRDVAVDMTVIDGKVAWARDAMGGKRRSDEALSS